MYKDILNTISLTSKGNTVHWHKPRETAAAVPNLKLGAILLVCWGLSGIKFVMEEAGNVGDVTLLAGHPQVAGPSVKHNLHRSGKQSKNCWIKFYGFIYLQALTKNFIMSFPDTPCITWLVCIEKTGYLKSLWWSSDGDGSIVLGVQVVGKGLWLRAIWSIPGTKEQ